MKYNFKEFERDFPDDNACLEFVFWNRWPDGGKCECGKVNSFYKVTGRRCYACSFCGFQLHPTAGTIFHKSETSLKSWFFAIFLMAQSRNGVAAKELQRQLGITYKTAHRGRKEYVRGRVHTNTIDGFWSQVKRSLDGTHHCVSRKYLGRYVDEFSFRYSHRFSAAPMFSLILDKAGEQLSEA